MSGILMAEFLYFVREGLFAGDRVDPACRKVGIINVFKL